MDPVQQSLNEMEEKMEQFGSDRDDLDLKINLERSKTCVSRKRERRVVDRHVAAKCANVDKQIHTFDRWAVKFEHRTAHLLKEATKEALDQLLRCNVDNERAIANCGYAELVDQNDAYIKEDEEKVDSALAQLKAQFDASAKEHANLKSVVESSLLQEKARGKKKVEVSTVLY